MPLQKERKGRPFLVVSRVTVASTVTESGWETKESIILVDSVTKKIMKDAFVIVDILKGKALINRATKNEENINDDLIVSFYIITYRKYIVEAIIIWLKKLDDTVYDLIKDNISENTRELVKHCIEEKNKFNIEVIK